VNRRKKMKKLGLFAIGLYALFIFSGCNEKKNFTIATGGTSGTYYPFGGAIANIWNAKIENLNVRPQATGASAENLQLISKGEAEFATVQNDVMDYAYRGSDMFAGHKLPNLASIGTLYQEVVQIAATKSSGIKSIADLYGKRVSVGAAGSGVEFNAKQILEGYGITFDDIQKSNLSFKESAEGLQNGTLDACFITAAVPNSALQELAFTAGLVLVPVNGNDAESICAKYSFYTKTTIPAGTYKGTDEDTEALAIKATLAVNASLDEELVYQMTRALFENLNELSEANVKGKEVSAEAAVTGISVPFHSGALRYFKETGILK
jgi:hypothetical protein